MPRPQPSSLSNRLQSRRRFLRGAAKASALAVAAPMIVPGHVLGKDGAVPTSERITLGAIGIGNRGSYVFKCFLAENDVHTLAVCDVNAKRKAAAKQAADERNGNTDCATYSDLRQLLDRKDIDAVIIATGPNWHAVAASTAARAGKDVYCEKPCSKTINESLMLADVFRRTGRVFQAGTQRRSLPHFMYAIDLARRGRLGKLHTVHAQPRGLVDKMSGWYPAEPTPPKEELDWDMMLGPAAYRPYNKALTNSFNFEKGGGFVGGLGGGGTLEWGSHCADLCQVANDADGTAPIEYEPQGNRLVCTYANGVKLVFRDDGWLPLGSCPVRFEGADGWVETADDGDIMASNANLLAGRRQKIGGYPANFHVRNFLDCVKSRSQPRANADAACWSHITCNAANIALFLNRKLKFDPAKCEFVNDAEANRLRSEARREPWRV
ncbi:MAG: Gfo/Idh/MocA family protein [Phycisphaerae bacterium]|nr:Gfo/Idh/MocA family oxidoreductase [Tepidisphaeraceae bacterium]